MKAYERLLSYVKVFTPSSEETGTSPSTQYQFDLARQLVQELQELGVKDASVDDHCYVYGHIPATEGYESCKKLGFIAHMDTVSDFCDHPVTPVVTPDYDGGELALETSGRVLSPKMFPHLSTLKGRTLITSDGTTILGADDKAGIAEIMTMIEHLNDGTIAHGLISVAFTPDEEIGMGTDDRDGQGVPVFVPLRVRIIPCRFDAYGHHPAHHGSDCGRGVRYARHGRRGVCGGGLGE